VRRNHEPVSAPKTTDLTGEFQNAEIAKYNLKRNSLRGKLRRHIAAPNTTKKERTENTTHP